MYGFGETITISTLIVLTILNIIIIFLTFQSIIKQ